MQVPFYRPSLTDAEISEVLACLKSGWLTTGPRAKQFEQEFASYIRRSHAVAAALCRRTSKRRRSWSEPEPVQSCFSGAVT